MSTSASARSRATGRIYLARAHYRCVYVSFKGWWNMLKRREHHNGLMVCGVCWSIVLIYERRTFLWCQLYAGGIWSYHVSCKCCQFDLLLLLLWHNNRCRSRPALYPLVKWAWLSLTYCYHSRIVSPTYGDTVYSGFEPMTTGILLRRTSWRLYHQTGPVSSILNAKQWLDDSSVGSQDDHRGKL